MRAPSGEGQRTRRKGSRSGKIAVFLVWFLMLSSSQLCTEAHSMIQSRKARFFSSNSDPNMGHAVGASSPSSVMKKNGSDKVYEDDKRIVHTGPNPLHN
nr:CLAVATA3/ESR (CLE)-related protein 17-like [Ipomoea batatas]GMD68180.1 CLAVATA3/ESR (CLE)-related protein 17-like [Ipomoea batatas]